MKYFSCKLFVFNKATFFIANPSSFNKIGFPIVPISPNKISPISTLDLLFIFS